jgi:chloramphenicol 3-O-phosphotransferase
VALATYVTLADRASGIAKAQLADPAYKRRYDLIVDTSKTTPEAGAAAIRKLIGSRHRGPDLQDR